MAFSSIAEEKRKSSTYFRFMLLWNECELVNLGVLKFECLIKNLEKLHEEIK